MATSKKSIATKASAVALAAALLIGLGSYSYLTGKTQNIENEFNTNNNSVELEETTGNKYDIVPGTSQDKDPTVTATYTLDSYVFLEVNDATGGLVDYDIVDGWKLLDTISNSDGSTTYVYYQLLENSGIKEINWYNSSDSTIKLYDEGSYTYIWDTNSNTITQLDTTNNDQIDVTSSFDLSTGNMYNHNETTTILQVLQGDKVSYSSSITNEQMEAAGDDISLTFQVYIIQAQLSGTTGDSLDDPLTAYKVVTTGASVYVDNATYVSLDASSSTNLGTQLKNAINNASSSETTVVVLPENSNISMSGYSFSSAINSTIVIDLNENELSLTGSIAVNLTNGDDLTIANGTLERSEMSGAAYSAFSIASNSSFTLDNVTATTNGCLCYPQGDAAEVNIVNSNVSGNGYVVATNAATVDNYNVEINIENSILNASYCPVLINVPGTLNISNSTITGGSQALVVRAGTASVNDTTLATTLGEDDFWTSYDSSNWGNGNAVAMAVITIGNRNGTYAGDAQVTLDNVKLQYDTTISGSKGIYMTGGVTYPATNSTPNKAILYYDSDSSIGKLVRANGTDGSDYTVVYKDGTLIPNE